MNLRREDLTNSHLMFQVILLNVWEYLQRSLYNIKLTYNDSSKSSSNTTQFLWILEEKSLPGI